MHEAQQHERNSFLTLTYSDETLAARRQEREPTVPCTPPSKNASPEDIASYSSYLASSLRRSDSLYPRDMQLFMKRLRKELTTLRGSAKVRFYLVGEYGDLFGRPHYHVALFGEDFSDDRKQWRTSGDYPIYRSSRLEKIWTHGNSEIGALTYDSAAYIARYVMKKINGKKADEHYRRETPEGDAFWLHPEFSLMSRRPGIGQGWLNEYINDVYPHDHVIIKGKKLKPPRYYDKILAALDPAAMESIKFEREIRARELAEDNTPARLAVKETVLLAKMAHNKRNLE